MRHRLGSGLRAVALAAASAALAASAVARASDLPPWWEESEVPIAPRVASATVLRREQPIVSGPDVAARRRGTAAQGARLPVFGMRRGPGCTGRFVQVGALAWVCEDAVALGDAPPVAPGPAWALEAPHGLPFSYYFVGRDGSAGDRSLRDAEQSAPDLELQPGFALAIVEVQTQDGATYGRTHHGLWVPMRDLGPVQPWTFHGEEIADGRLAFGWVVEDKVPVFTRPDAGARGKGVRARFERIEVLETSPKGFVRVADGAWLRARDVRVPKAAPPPDELRAGERWLDIDLATQTLVALEGSRPVFATLVSTGKGAEGTELATPRGTHRIWVKLESANMDNLEDENAERFYAIEDVPYVMFFAKGVGLHGEFWHRGLGHVRSHGCVNLAPLDAERLFGFVGPRLPAGWTAVLPTDVEPGTIVRVR